MSGALSVEDFVAVQNHMGKYCWLIDENQVEAWLDMWTDDAVFTGVTPEPMVGREGLKLAPHIQHTTPGANMRHSILNFHAEYGASKNDIVARFYNIVTDWGNGGKFFCLAICEAEFVRVGAGWKIKRNTARFHPGFPS